MSTDIETQDWQHYLTRPFSLFGCSLWYQWYAEYAQRLVENDISDMLCVEEELGVIRNYRRAGDLQHLTETIGSLAKNNPTECEKMLDQGFLLNEEAEKYLAHEKEFKNFDEALEFFFEDALYATILPHFVILGMEKLEHKNEALFSKSEKLRSESFYPRLLSEIIIPIAQEQLIKHGLEDINNLDLLLLDEVVSGNFSELEERKKMRGEDKLYIYKVIDRKPDISWHQSNDDLIQKIEQTKVSAGEVSGQSAYKGTAVGTVRIIKTIDGAGATFDEGDILVTINSNPNLMHLIQKAGAIVADEGGITCHAAIVSRELKIPCVIGTQNATQVFKEGDIVEVDAENGIVKLLKS